LEAAQAGQPHLSWTAPTTNTDGTPLTDQAGYKLHMQNATRSHQQHIDVGTATNYLASNLTDGSTYYFAVTAYDTSGLDSSYSNEVSKSLAAATHLTTATYGSGGSITALSNSNYSVATSGTTTITSAKVSDGANQPFSVAAASGYSVSDLKVDGTSVEAVTSYTFSTVKADHTLSATFVVKASYTISASAGTGGSITPSGTASVEPPASRLLRHSGRFQRREQRDLQLVRPLQRYQIARPAEQGRRSPKLDDRDTRDPPHLELRKQPEPTGPQDQRGHQQRRVSGSDRRQQRKRQQQPDQRRRHRCHVWRLQLLAAPHGGDRLLRNHGEGEAGVSQHD
jgi:hypothetical protein